MFSVSSNDLSRERGALTGQTFATLCLAIFLFLSALVVWKAWQAADGHLIFTLDDPYIHLAVAETLLQGGYGVNFPETSSPSSSILYTLLLAPFVALGIGPAGALGLSLAAQGAAVWLVARLIWDHLLEALPEGLRLPAGSGVALLMPLALNGYGLPMTGMEHSIHLFATVLVMLGLHRTAETDRVPFWLIPAILLAALVRFEGFALATAAIGALVWCRKGRSAALALLLLALVTTFYAAAMHRLGLPPLPSSVMVKSGASAAASEGHLLSVAINGLQDLNTSLMDRNGAVLALGCLLTGLLAVSPAVSRPGRLVAAVAAAALGAHLMFGKFGWFGRYEPYAVALALVALTAAGGRALSTLRPVWAGPTVALAVLGVVAVPFLTTAKDTPAASRNIFEQQYQMHRFATEFFPRTVAVNDLGWVAYRNDGHVLDLWGLGSEEVRRATRSAGGLTPELIAELADRKGAVYAMIYDRWFEGRVPPSWCRMAVLRTSLVTAGSDEVSFYLIDPAEAPAMAGALARFAPTLPAGASLEVIPCPRP
ncbi:hypothetical protein ACN9JG_21425 (plasmid) [Cereibacter azotoformans]|uniref:hypothetical protein n=1 Tax=Cereibacter azotoformans TaxID=43057 RepID=UPI003B2103DA